MFKFWPGNHSVIESLYRWPCIPRFAVDGKPGYVSILNYTVLNLDPFFYHCGAPGSCVSQGMLGAINPREDQNVTAQKELATKAGIVLTTSETLSPDKASSMSAVAATVMPEEHEVEHDDGHEDEHKRKLSAGAIAGIVIGGVIGLALMGVSIFALGRQRAQKKTPKNNPNEPARQAHTTVAPAPEMQIDGITYVPATDHKAMYGPQPPPSYHHLSPDVRPNSPESTFSSPHGAPTTLYSPSIGSIRNRYI
ncbi:hypothetical protein PRZ48_004065 [Zasmidium cellare]|uniref:Uncharacterized protein n=1 Tax=Zasmidium cellare TaxID=395010 RepID=A0ABR0EYF6_ZASCE|nr:hypothetical protein PRZ48_004065 [Zasmidium cellare]